jgi:ribosomal 50S subunit-associated protein YjgA (DUF615 family)
MRSILLLIIPLLAGCARLHESSRQGSEGDRAFDRFAQDYISGWLAWRPQMGTALGFHQYDGKLTDFSQSSLTSELTRLKDFGKRLASLETNALSPTALHDYRLLNGAIQREIFWFEQRQVPSRNPMIYAGALDVNIYIRRNFAPLEERVQSITAVLNQAPKVGQRIFSRRI